MLAKNKQKKGATLFELTRYNHSPDCGLRDV